MSFLHHILALVLIPFIAIGWVFSGHHQTTQTASATSTIEQQTFTSTSTPSGVNKPIPPVVTPASTRRSIVPAVSNPNTTNISRDTNAADINDLVSTLDNAIAQFQDLESNAESGITSINSDAARYSQGIPSYASFANASVNSFNSFIAEVESYIVSLKTARNNAVSTGSMDKGWWMNVGIQNIVATQATYTQQLIKLESLYIQGRAGELVLDSLQSASSYQSPPQVDPAIQQQIQQVQQTQDCISQQEQQIRDEISASGGTATESQVEAMAISRCTSN